MVCKSQPMSKCAMSDVKHLKGIVIRTQSHARGTAAVEFSILASLFFCLVFGIMEVSRILFVYNTLQEVTRRAAASAAQVYPRDSAAIQATKQKAIFRTSPGELVLATPVSDQHVRLEYLRYDLSVIPQSDWPDSASQQRQICMANPHANNCIRFVQAQICDPGVSSECSNVRSQMLIPLVNLAVPLPKATTITTVESFGYSQGSAPSAPLPPGT